MKKQVAVIVIPTYNEADNIGRMLEHLSAKTFPGIKNYEMKVLVVDGNSPDGTGKVVEKITKKYPNIFLYTETSKDGIGAAYLKGFKHAMEKMQADFVFEFDGDFQHPPALIPVMLKDMEEGYDYVIGSRKIKGGSNPKGWGFKRIFFSEVGGFTARFIMFFPFGNFWKVTDPTTGLKVTRVKGFTDHLNLDFKHLYTKSFGYKLQLLYETLKLGAKFKEVPMKFQVRNAGESKIEPQTAKDIFLVACKLRWNDDFTQKFLKFGCIGLFGFAINKVGLDIFANLFKPYINTVGLRNLIANALASEISIVSNFALNNMWTFKNEKITAMSHLVKKFTAFNASSIVSGIVIPSIVIALGTQIFGDTYRTILLVIAIFGVTVPLNWYIYNHVIWKKK